MTDDSKNALRRLWARIVPKHDDVQSKNVFVERYLVVLLEPFLPLFEVTDAEYGWDYCKAYISEHPNAYIGVFELAFTVKGNGDGTIKDASK